MGLLGSEEHECTAKLETAEHGTYTGQVVDNDETSVVIGFPKSRFPKLPVAEEVALHLVVDSSGIDLKGRMVHYSRSDDDIRYTFKLADEDATTLVRLFRRRNAFRAKPDPRIPVGVVIETPSGLRSRAELFDISATGMAVVIDPDAENSLFRKEPLRLHFRLPGQAQVFDMYARIRSRSLYGSAIRYGLDFDTKASKQAVLQGERIIKYVMDRQIKAIQRRRNAS